ncbi:MAG TPA: M17 family peptidase N-terminal domain-containing protein, partial [Thauera aminoaromatica]|nr:M17 family peptidase N-terminal domain-containing protein [Thauera aminoaromatica]
MEFTIKTGSPAKLKTGLLVLGAFAEGRLPALSAAADGAAEGRLAALIKRGDLEEKAGATLLVHDLPGVHAERVLLVSLGKHDEFGDKAWRDALAAAAKAISSGPAKDAVVALADVELPGRDAAWRLQQATRILADGAYRFDALKSDKKAKKDRGAKKLGLLVSCELGAELDTAAL